MYVIGVTGSLKTGKSTVSQLFAQKGALVLDADKIARRLLGQDKECIKKILNVFGDNILRRGRIDRARLAREVFGHPGRLKQLVKIIHPLVRKEIRTKLSFLIKRGYKKVVVLDVPLLFEAGMDALADLNVVVYSSQANQIKRAVRQMKISKSDAIQRIKAQMPLRQKMKLADVVIGNNGSITAARKQVNKTWDTYVP